MTEAQKRRKDDWLMRVIVGTLITVVVAQGGAFIYNYIVTVESVKNLSRQVENNTRAITELAANNSKLAVIENKIANVKEDVNEIKNDVKTIANNVTRNHK